MGTAGGDESERRLRLDTVPRPLSGGAAPGALRVLVLAHHPMLRAGLAQLVAELPDVVVVGEGGSLDQAIPADQLRPDVVLLAQEGVPGESAELIQIAGAIPAPLVLIGELPSSADLARLLSAGVSGCLPLDAAPEQVAAALRAAAAGLLVLGSRVAALLPDALPPDRRATERDEPLTDREMQVLQLVAHGLPNKGIARRLGISEHTVKFHVGSILGKLGVSSRTEAVTQAAHRGLLTL